MALKWPHESFDLLRRISAIPRYKNLDSENTKNNQQKAASYSENPIPENTQENRLLPPLKSQSLPPPSPVALVPGSLS